MKRLSLLFLACALPLSAQLRITEVMSNSNHLDPQANGDWFEITNTGTTAVNVGGYSFDDDSATVGTSGGFPSYLLQAGASMIVLNNASSVNFRSLWNIPASVRIITASELSNFPGLGAAGDEIYLFNNGGGLVNSYIFGAATTGFSFARFNNGQSVPGGLSSDGVFAAYRSNDPDEDIGSPGISTNLPDPLPPFFVAPFKTAVIAGSSLTVSEYRVRSVDPNPGDTVTLSLSGAPSWLGISPVSSGIGRFTGTPQVSDIGAHVFEVIATDNTMRTTSQTYRIDVLPASSPIILNEYNGVGPELFLNGGDENLIGGASDPFLGRVEGNGGAWAEFVVTQTTDLRGWTLTIKSETQTRILKLSDHVALSNIPAGTILTFSERNRYLSTSFNRTSNLSTTGFTWSNIWMHDAILIDQANSTHPATPAISSDDTTITWSNASDQIIYGPAGESIALSDTNLNGIGDSLIGVGDAETFRLEANPTATTNPLNINYDDAGSSSFGAPNLWSNDTLFQSFTAYINANTPPQFGILSSTKAVRGSFNAQTAFTSGATVTALTLPDFITLTINGNLLTLTNNRPLTQEDIGSYEVTLQADNGAPANNLTYLVFELEVLNPAPSLILNEYNAVEPDRYLNGGTAALDSDGAPASQDSHFGRVLGNGGDWFELAVVGDDGPGYANLTNWSIEVGQIASSGKFIANSTITLSDAASWSAVPHGTLLTFIENNTAAGGLNTEFNRVDQLATTGYAWSNIHLGTPGVITGTNLNNIRINSSNTAFVIKDASGLVVFGPAGEGVAPLDGVGGSEIFELENDPSSSVSSIDTSSDTFLGYDDGSSGSTFGSPNLFAPIGSPTDRAQDFTPYILSAFQLYLADRGLAGATATDDSDQDGFSNLDEYLLGGDPSSAALFPVTILDTSSGIVSLNVRTNDPNYVLTPERSADLLNWVTDSLVVEDAASDLGPNFVLRQITYTGTAPRMFFRVSTGAGN